MSSIVEFTKSELDRIGMTEDNEHEINRFMREHLIHMVEEFSKAGHSGFLASYALNSLTKLLNWEPLSPLTGDESEWTYIATLGDNDMQYQNNRCSRVFKGSDGRAYDIEGKVFVEECVDGDGVTRESSYTSSDSRVYVDFPYTPTTEYVRV